MFNIATKRICKDISILENDKENLNKSGIYWHLNESNMYNIKTMHIGNDTTPYAYGYYFLDYKLPENYPFAPPVASSITQGERIRFHPHLYTSSKVCLSILNTWSGEKWSASQTLLSVFNTLQIMVFVNNPLLCEPAYEKENPDGYRSTQYNLILKYANIKIAILNMLENIPIGFQPFQETMEKQFLFNYKNIIKNLETLKQYDKTPFKFNCPWNMSIFVDINQQFNRCKKLRRDYESKYGMIINRDTLVSVENIEISTDKKRKRQSPNEKASNFDIGFKMKSNNNGRMYIVKTMTNGKKRWYLHKS
jgi:ubiquitin-protein ligase